MSLYTYVLFEASGKLHIIIVDIQIVSMRAKSTYTVHKQNNLRLTENALKVADLVFQIILHSNQVTDIFNSLPKELSKK